MQAEHGFDDYIDNLVVAIADKQTEGAILPIDILELHKELFANAPPTWVHVAPRELEKRGYGRDHSTLKARVFLIDGGGLSRAQEVRRMRTPTGPLQKLREVPRSDWIAILALLTSMIALFK